MTVVFMAPQHPSSDSTVFLDQPPSCLQFCPAASNHVVIGTYLLSETKEDDGTIQQEKTGSLQLWERDPAGNTLSCIQKLYLPYAVFDLHFHPRDPNLLAITGSLGCVALFRVLVSGGAESITPLWTKPVHEDSSIPALFLAWTPRDWFTNRQADGFAVTFSDGQTTVFGSSTGNITQAEDITDVGTYHARQMIEVWFVSLTTYHNAEGNAIPFLFTGDDFGSLHTRRLDLLSGSGGNEQDILPPTLLDYDDRARHHTSGTTAILPLPLPLVDDAPLLLTGSYDEYLRIYHATRRGAVLAELCLGGGVWRLQILKTDSPDDVSTKWRFLVLASCMHGGTRVVKITGDGESEWDIEILAEFTEHESMNYASDVWKDDQKADVGTKKEELLCLSSSFYDKRVCLWRVDI